MATPVEGTDASSGLFPPFDPASFPSQLLWLAITFGLFYYLMSRIALPRISSVLEVRSDRIARDIDEANRLREESDEAIAAYEQELAEARTNAHKIAGDARDASKAEIDAQRAAVEASLNAKIADAETRIDEIRVKAMGEVGTIAEDAAQAILSELYGGTVSKQEVASAVAGARN